MKLLIVILFSIALSSAQINQQSPCPNRPPMENFDLLQYASRDWYAIASFNDNYDGGHDCSYINWGEVINDTLVSVEVCSYINGIESCFSGFFGYADPTIRNGNTLYSITGTQSLLLRNEGLNKKLLWLLTGGPVSEAKILYADYENFVIAYDCENLESGGSKEFLYVLVPQPYMDESVIANIEEYIEANFEKKNIKVKIHKNDFCSDKIKKKKP